MGIALKKRHNCFWLKDSLTSEQDLMHDTVSPEGFKIESTEYRGFHGGAEHPLLAAKNDTGTSNEP